MRKIGQEAKRFSKYSIVGLVNNLVLYGLFLLLLWINVSPVIATGLCYVIGVAISYLLNRKWTYQSQSTHARDLPKFLMAYGIGLFSTLVTMTILVVFIPPEVAQIINIGLTAVIIYTMLMVLNFGVGDGGHAD